jgi:hypothetical protein
MNRKILSLITFLGAVVGYAQSSPVYAEFVCSADVSYRWVKEGARLPSDSPPAKDGENGSASGREGGSAGEAKEADTKAAEKVDAKKTSPTESLVRFASIERRGMDEQSARAGLLVEVNRQKARAHDRCRREHESFGDCVSTKMAIKASTLNSLSFSARSKVEEALIDECRVQQGRCTAIDSGEPLCRDLSPVPAAAAPEGGEPKATSGAKGDTASKGEPAADKAGGDKKAAEPAADKSKAAKKKP